MLVPPTASMMSCGPPALPPMYGVSVPLSYQKTLRPFAAAVVSIPLSVWRICATTASASASRPKSVP